MPPVIAEAAARYRWYLAEIGSPRHQQTAARLDNGKG